MNFEKIKFVFFDVGGVLILDFSHTDKWSQMKRDLGVTAETEQACELVWQRHADRRGIDYDIDHMIPELEKEVGLTFPKDYSLLTEFISRFDANQSIWQVVKKAQQLGKKVGPLTNMYPRMFGSIQKAGLMQDIKWDLIIDSSVVGVEKPDPKIYVLAEKQTKLKPEEIFFIDNMSENVEAAAQRGWQTFLYDDQHPEEASAELLKIFDA